MSTKYDLLLCGGRVIDPLASLDANVLGSLRVGGVADVSVLADERGRWTLRDNENTGVVCERMSGQ
jgi:predicted amidohydrolase